ncbi:hypothetical protein [Brevibacillus migulae]|uniref:hypothetical protein n=1 Tax=Brevibacillus migulae TaxID=1644114 RepID=UPI00106F05BB|nr:hypothetical protein [Brevibacillus migulae]
MKIKQTQLNRYAKIKYSEIPGTETTAEHRSRVAMGYLMKNGYACMNGHAINEIINLIRSLRELRIEYTMSVIQHVQQTSNISVDGCYYEFTLGYFEDDRETMK